MLYFFLGDGLIFKGYVVSLGRVNLLIFECINKHIWKYDIMGQKNW